MRFSRYLDPILVCLPENFRCLAYGLSPKIKESFYQNSVFITPWRQDYLDFKNQDYKTLPDFETLKKKNDPPKFDIGLLELCKHKGRNGNKFLHLLDYIKTGGWVFVHGAKQVGGLSFYKKLALHIKGLKPLHHDHGISCIFKNTPHLKAQLYESFYSPPKHFDNFTTFAGLFSHGRSDFASQLLIKYIPKADNLRIADLGAGWGYLSYHCLGSAAAIDLYEADYEALMAAKHNLAGAIKDYPSLELRYFWRDISRDPLEQGYDVVLSNPPFHEDKKLAISLGQTFIVQAAKILKKNASAYFVANKFLPYETILEKNFRYYKILSQEKGFKIIKAVK